MAQQFDPYFKWLGIPPDEQPPNHYRLLGVPLLVDDPDVIANAADRQMMMLRSLQAGDRMALSQKLLNEISHAKACLLSPERKAEYDASLDGSALDENFENLELAPRRATKARPLGTPAARGVKARSKRGLHPAWLAVGGVALVAALGVPLVMMLMQSTGPSTPSLGTSAANPPAPAAASPKAAAPASTNHAATNSAPINSAPINSAPINSAPINSAPINSAPINSAPINSAPINSAPVNSASINSAPINNAPVARTDTSNGPAGPLDTTPPPANTTRPTGSAAGTPAIAPVADLHPPRATSPNPPEDPAADPAGEDALPAHELQPAPQPVKPVAGPAPPVAPAASKALLPVPDAATLAEKTRELHELLKADYKEAQAKPERRDQLRDKLMNLARESLAKDPTTSYVCAVEAASMAAERDLQEAFATQQWLGQQFAVVDPPARKGELVRRFKIESFTVDTLPDMVGTLETLMDGAEEEMELGVIVELGKVALRAARKSKDPALVARIQARSKRLGTQRDSFEAASQAKKALADNPQDTQANLDLGRFLCFVRGNWDAGLPRLAAGSDTQLAELAKRDLAHPGTPQEQLEMAESWWAMGDASAVPGEAPSAAPGEMRQRAAYYYGQAAPKLAGLEKVRAEQRAATFVPKPAGNAAAPQAQPGETVPLAQVEMLGTERSQRRQVVFNRKESHFESRYFKGRESSCSLMHSLDILTLQRDGFKTDKQYLSIQGEVVSDSASTSAVAVYYILADNRPIWRSPRITSEDGFTKFQVAIGNAQVVQLVCENVGRERVRAGWANLTATKKKTR